MDSCNHTAKDCAEAVKLLQQRVRELPDSYEPPARLAEALIALGEKKAAVAPLTSAIAKAYGPRKLRYLSMMADLRFALADEAKGVEALEALVAHYEQLPEGHKRHPRWKQMADKTRERLKRPRR